MVVLLPAVAFLRLGGEGGGRGRASSNIRSPKIDTKVFFNGRGVVYQLRMEKIRS
jgi:hypothetical protein